MINIAIVGGGVVGLSAATELQDYFKSAARITIYSENLSPNTTSDISAGLWTIYLVSNSDLGKVSNWASKTFERFLDLWKGGHSDEAGISLIPAKVMLEDDDTWLEDKVVFGAQPMSKPQVDEVNQRLHTSYSSGVTFVTFICQVTRYLPFMSKRFLENGGRIVVRRVEALEELDCYDVIVNCTGLNARVLVNDSKVLPIRGQVMKVRAPWQFYTFIGGKHAYVIPNQDNVVLGGPAQYGDYDRSVRKSESEEIIRECCKMVPSLKNAKLLTEITGLRPARDEIRLEAEIQRINEREVLVVHNYGHGGSGVTLSHGCALDVVKLVEKTINVVSKSKL